MKRGRWPRWVLLAPLMLLGVVSARWFSGVLPACLFHKQTGLLCPGCGATRSALALAEGRWAEALQNNLLFVLAVVVGGGWIVFSAARQRFPENKWLALFRFRLRHLWMALGLLLVFAILRNASGMEVLRPR